MLYPENAAPRHVESPCRIARSISYIACCILQITLHTSACKEDAALQRSRFLPNRRFSAYWISHTVSRKCSTPPCRISLSHGAKHTVYCMLYPANNAAYFCLQGRRCPATLSVSPKSAVLGILYISCCIPHTQQRTPACNKPPAPRRFLQHTKSSGTHRRLNLLH